MTAAKSKLRGKAQDAIRGSVVLSFLDLQKALLRRFRPTDRILAEYGNLKQNLNESVREYGDRFYQCYRNLIDEVRSQQPATLEHDAKRKFRYGLKESELRAESSRGEVSNLGLQEFIKSVVQIDKSIRLEAQTLPTNAVCCAMASDVRFEKRSEDQTILSVFQR